MKKSFLLRLGALAMCVSGSIAAHAQIGSAAEILGARLTVDAPTSITQPFKFTYSSQDAGSAWGGAITSAIVHQVVVKPTSDSLGCIGTMSSNVSGKWVLIYRGNCEFGSKALHAQQAGATGIIIWDHTPNEPLVNMAAGSQGSSVTIPVLFISHNDGLALSGEISANDSAHITLTKWGFSKTHDLGLISHSEAMPHALAMPSYQFDGTDVPYYRGYTGAFVVNTGSSTETNVKVKSVVSFTPNGGSSSVVNTDSVVVASLSTSDSITFDAFSPRAYKLNPSGPGVYNYHYELSSDNTDELPGDNTEDFTMTVTNNAYCKGAFNNATQEPVISADYAVTDASGNTVTSTWGPLFYIHKGGYAFTGVKFGAMPVDTNIHYMSQADPEGKLALYIFKWKDNNNDTFMESDEVTMVSAAVKQFASTDSADGKTIYTAIPGKAPDGSSAEIATEADTWYWVVADVLTEYRIGGDGNVNFYNRTRAAQDFATNKLNEYWAPRWGSDVSSLSSGSDVIQQIPFGVNTVGATGTIDSAKYTSNVGTPNIALFTTTFPLRVEKVTNKIGDKLDLYPNPAVNQIVADVTLAKPSASINLRVVNSIGQTVYMENHKDVTNGKFTVDISKLSAGNYYMVMINGEQAITRPFTVTK